MLFRIFLLSGFLFSSPLFAADFSALRENLLKSENPYLEIRSHYRQYMDREDAIFHDYDILRNFPLAPKNELLHRLAYTSALVETDAAERSFEMLYDLKDDIEQADHRARGLYFHSLSRFYAMARRSEEAYICNKMSIAELEKTEAYQELSWSYTNMVFIGGIKEGVDVHYYYQKAIALEKQHAVPPASLLRCNMAYVKMMQQETDSAWYYTSESVKLISSENPSPIEDYRTQVLMATIYFQRGDYENETRCMDKAKQICIDNGYLFNLKNVSRYIAGISGNHGEFERAYKNMRMSDSLNQILLQKGMGDKTQRFDLEKKIRDRENENLRVKELLAIKQKSNLMLGGLIGMSLIALLIVIQKANQIHRKNLLLTEQNLNLAKKEEPRTRPDTLSDELMQSLIEKLEVLIYDKLIYKDVDLSLDKLAKKLNSNRTYVSEAIRARFQTGFSTWLNEVRINAARKLLADPANDFYSIEGIAKEVGYGSISTFNTTFRKLTGLTPSQFKKLRDSVEKQ